MVIDPQTPVEVSRGRLKAFCDCSPAERRDAVHFGEERAQLIRRWVSLLGQLGETWIPRTPFVMRMGARDFPPDLTVPQMESEIEKLEIALEMKRRGTGSEN